MASFDKDQAQKEALYRAVMEVSNNPTQFSATNNIAIIEIAEDYTKGELTVTSSSLNPHGYVHGGCLATLADTVAGAAVASHRRSNVTITCTMNYLAPAKGPKITCVATPQKLGGSVCVFDCLLTDQTGTQVATGVFTFFIVDRDRFRKTSRPE